jgi:hypothetical protein
VQTIYLEVTSNGAMLLFSAPRSAAVAITLPDNVSVTAMPVPLTVNADPPSQTRVHPEHGFPPRTLTEGTILQVLREHGGRVRIRQDGWNIYDELAARLGVSVEARRRRTSGTGEPAWRPEVGFARKNLEQRGELAPTEMSGRGVWQLKA